MAAMDRALQAAYDRDASEAGLATLWAARRAAQAPEHSLAAVPLEI